MRILYGMIFIFFSFHVQAQSQSEKNTAARETYLKADGELKAVYFSILDKYAGDTLFIKHFTSSQKIWTELRNAEVRMKYPDRQENPYQSEVAMCISLYMAELTTTRISHLNQWLKGSKDNSPCLGSVWTGSEK